MSKPLHVHRTYVRGTVEEVWAAITDPDFTERYFFRTRLGAELSAGAGFRYVLPDGTDAVEGAIEVVEPLRRLVMTWRVLYDAGMSAEPPSRVEWMLTPGDGVTMVTLIHRDLARSPRTSESVEFGWAWVLDGLKTLVETGAPLGTAIPADVASTTRSRKRTPRRVAQRTAARRSTPTWALLDGRETDAGAIDDLLGRAYRPCTTGDVPPAVPENAARASWLVSRTWLPATASWRCTTPSRLRRWWPPTDSPTSTCAYAHEARRWRSPASGVTTTLAARALAAAVPINRFRGCRDRHRRPRRRPGSASPTSDRVGCPPAGDVASSRRWCRRMRADPVDSVPDSARSPTRSPGLVGWVRHDVASPHEPAQRSGSSRCVGQLAPPVAIR